MKTRMLFALALALLAIPHVVIAYAVSVPALNLVGAAMLLLAALAARFDRWWAVAPGVVISVVAAVHTFAFYSAFMHFDSGAEFSGAVSALVLGTTAAVLGGADLVARRRRSTATVSRSAVRVFTLGVALLVVVSAASAATTIATRDTVSAADREDALLVNYKDTDVVDGTNTLTAPSGEVRIVVDNQDVAFHNFVIKDSGISVDLGPKESKLVVADLAPGTYTFKCTIGGHGAMTGTIVVK
jgi:heme/copper-type cytochrome/quinol oxidase subunit 2